MPGCNSAGAAKRSYPTSEVRAGAREELPLVQRQGQWLRVPSFNSTGASEGSYPHPTQGVAAGRSNPMSKEQQLCGHRRAERSYSTFKVRRGGREEIPLIQSKEQRLRFAGAAMKRYPTSKVRETPVRW